MNTAYLFMRARGRLCVTYIYELAIPQSSIPELGKGRGESVFGGSRKREWLKGGARHRWGCGGVRKNFCEPIEILITALGEVFFVIVRELFVSFYVIAAFLLINLVVGAVCNNYDTVVQDYHENDNHNEEEAEAEVVILEKKQRT